MKISEKARTLLKRVECFMTNGFLLAQNRKAGQCIILLIDMGFCLP